MSALELPLNLVRALQEPDGAAESRRRWTTLPDAVDYAARRWSLDSPTSVTPPTTLADLLALDAERLRQWLFARCVQGSVDQPHLRRPAVALAP